MNYLKSIQIDSRNFGIEHDLVNKHIGNAKTSMDRAANSYAKLGGKIESANQLTGPVKKRLEARGSVLDSQDSLLQARGSSVEVAVTPTIRFDGDEE